MSREIDKKFQVKMARFRTRFDELGQEAAKKHGLDSLSKDTLDWLWNLFLAELHTRLIEESGTAAKEKQ